MNHDELLSKFADDTISPAEMRAFWDEMARLGAEERGVLEERYEQLLEARTGYGIVNERLKRAMQQRIAGWENVRPVDRLPLLGRAWVRYAAVVLLALGVGMAVWVNNERSPAVMTGEGTVYAGVEKDIQPGGNKAVLTLADGRRIVLDSAANGALADQSGVKILKLDAGKLAYQGNGANKNSGYNTISTPKGGLYQVELPDGSRVWLNAASSIRFPTVFVQERAVSITGEVYFEVVADKKKPFIVDAEGERIEVLGTSFNVHAYADERGMKTSLSEGSVKVSGVVLKPGQAFVNQQVVTTDIEQDLAWKNGYFNFNKVSLENAMRQIANWYDVSIVYERGIPKRTFYGEVARDRPLSKMLDFLSSIGVRCRQEGRTVIVLP